MSHEELLIALEKIVIDKVSTVPTTRHKKNDSSAPMQVGMAAKEDRDTSREEGDQRIMDIALQAVHKDQAQATGLAERAQTGTYRGTKVAKVAMMQTVEERTHGIRAMVGKEAKDKRKEARATADRVGLVAKQDILAASCPM